MSKEAEGIQWVKGIFTFSNEPDDFSLSASNTATRDFESDCKKNSVAKKDLEKTLELMRNGNKLKRELKSKPLKKKIKEPKSNRVNTLHQCRTKNGKGRLWFVIKDEAPGAPKPTILILGAQLLGHNRNSDRIKDLAKSYGLPPSALNESVEGSDELIVSKGRSIEFELSWGNRPLTNKNFDEMIKFTKRKMGIRPTNAQLETIMHSKTPIFINGQAGTGKTCMLSLRASLKHIENERDRARVGICPKCGAGETRRTLITSMSEDVVKMMEENIEEALQEIFTDDAFGIDTRKNALADFNKSIKIDNKKLWQTSNDINNFLCFRRFRKMQLDLIPQKTQLLFNDDSRNIKFSRFSDEFFSKRDYTNLGVEQAWFGIRTILRGLCASPEFNDESGSSKEYRYLDEKELKIILKKNKGLLKDFDTTNQKELLKCHQDYRKWLKEKNYYDDMDLARQTWKFLDNYEECLDDNESDFDLFDEIYLDEAQDLTDLEFRILLKLLKPKKMKAIILAGDPLQTINPSGFSWNNLKSMLWLALKEYSGKEEVVDDPMKLSVNYRTPSNIVDIGNIFLNKRTYYQEESDSTQSSTIPPGELFILQIGETHKQIIRKLIEQDSKRFIISRHADDKGIEQLIDNDDLIASEIDNPKIYSITQVKGLESEEVLLYCMGESLIETDISPILTGIKRAQLGGKEKLKISIELNKMYIGLTRSQKKMYVLAKKREIERLWNSVWFEEGQFKIITNPKDVLDQLEFIKKHSDEHTNYAELAKYYLELYNKNLDIKFLKFAESSAKRVDNSDNNILTEIEAHLSYVESRELSGDDKEKKLLSAAKKFRRAALKKRAYKIYINELIHIEAGPREALAMLKTNPTLSDNPVEIRILKMIRFCPETKDYSYLSKDMNNLPKWYNQKYHGRAISKSISKMMRGLSSTDRLGLLIQIVEEEIVLKEQNEKWFEEFVTDTPDNDLWKLFKKQLKKYIPNSKVLRTKYDSLAEAKLEKITGLDQKLKFYKTWSKNNKSREKELSNEAFLMILKTEFEHFTPVSINKSKYPFKLKPSEHEEYYDWAIKHGNKYSGRSVDLLLNIGNDKWGGQYNLDSDKFFALWNCIGQKQSKLDLSSKPLSEGTEIDYLNNYLLKLLDNWIRKESLVHSSDEDNKYSGINKTDLWIDCEKNSLKMKDLIDFLLLKLPEVTFCRSFIECYQPSVPQFQTNFRKVAKNHFEKDNRLSHDLRKLFCKYEEYDFILKSPSVHNNHKLFVEAHKIDDNKISSSSTELKKAINIYTRLGLSNEATNLRKSLPIDIDGDLITIKAKNTSDLEKIREMLDLFTRAIREETGLANERLKEIIITNLFNDKMLTTLLNNHDQLHSKIDILMKDVDVKIEDNLIFNYWKLPRFVLLNELEARKGELTNQHQGMLSRNLEVALRDTLSSLQNLPDVGDQYSTTLEKFQQLWWEPSGKYKSGSFIALLEKLESKPTQSELKEYLRYLGIPLGASDLRPKQVKSLLDYYEGDQLYQNNVGLLNIYGRLCK